MTDYPHGISDDDVLEVMTWKHRGHDSYPTVEWERVTRTQWIGHTEARRRNGQLCRFTGRWNEDETLAVGSNICDLCADCGEYFIMDILTDENAGRAPICSFCSERYAAGETDEREGN